MPWLALCAAATLLTACAAGPDYVRPRIELPPTYKEAGPWKHAQPWLADSRTPWWRIYSDSVLDGLMDEAMRANQSLQVSEAQYREAHALSAAAQAAMFPTLSLGAAAARARTPLAGRGVVLQDALNASASGSWVPDLWGGVRRSIEAAEAGEAATADDLAGAELAIQAELAQDYLSLRITDLQRDLYASTIAGFARALQLTQSQYRAGVTLRSDVALAENQLKTAQAQSVDLDAARAQLEHAIAILTGRAPATFALPVQPLTVQALRSRVPEVPAQVPSELLQRRPDIAAAERRAAAANASIGVAQSAFYPSLTLTGSLGAAGSTLGALVDTPGRVWSLGAALAGTVFDGGLRSARRDQAAAAYDATAAQYKQSVLAALRQVEDNLALVRLLNDELDLELDAVAAAQLAERSALAQYRAGSGSYLAVITAQTLALTGQRTAAQLLGRELAASVGLVTALGGGWSAPTQTSSTTDGTAPPSR